MEAKRQIRDLKDFVSVAVKPESVAPVAAPVAMAIKGEPDNVNNNFPRKTLMDSIPEIEAFPTMASDQYR